MSVSIDQDNIDRDEFAEAGSMILRAEEQTEEYKELCNRRQNLLRTEAKIQDHGVIVQRLINKARDDLVWAQYMKCDGLPDPACVKELNTYLTLWKEDEREDLDSVLARTQEV